jgi:hypothetical protein
MDLSIIYDPDDDDCNKSELDSHADTCVAGANTVPLWYTDAKVSISPFIGEYSPLENIPIATVATAWDSSVDGSTIILIINEALYFGDRMNHSLLCPNKLRDFGLIVNDVPKSYDALLHIQSSYLMGRLNYPSKCGESSHIWKLKEPTDEELLKCPRYEMTAAASWDPYKVDGDNSSWGYHRFDREAQSLRAHWTTTDMIYPLELREDVLLCLVSAISTLPEPHHEADVIAHFDDFVRETSALNAKARSSVITKEEFATRWLTGLESEKATLLATTQEGMRFMDGDLERRLKTTQKHLCFPTLNIQSYTCSLIFTDSRKFFRAYPMAKKADAHHALTAFIQNVGIPKFCLSDGAKEERGGEWGRIIQHYHIKAQTTEPKSP